jgi:dihydrofolate reductase
VIDELRLTVHPIVLVEGKPLFGGVTQRHRLTLDQAQPLPGGRLSLTYSTIAPA